MDIFGNIISFYRIAHLIFIDSYDRCLILDANLRVLLLHKDASFNDHFISYGCSDPIIPILLAAPHAGRDYPAELLQDIRISADQLLRLEDRYVDILVKDCAANHIPTMIARAPRAIIDLNRSEDEIDADMVVGLDWTDVAHPTVKTRGGLGLIPRRLSGVGEIWRNPIGKHIIEQRISKIHQPYHDYIAWVMDNMVQKFGVAVLLDVHSMPSLKSDFDKEAAQWVIGDRYAASADNIYSDLISSYLKQAGYEVALNSPYSGGYILQRHGNPKKGKHALQIEIDRNLYLDRDNREPIDNNVIISEKIADIVDIISANLGQELEAAE